MRLNSLDGLYYLCTAKYQGSEPPVPEDAGASTAVAENIVAVSTFGTWSDIDVTVVETHSEWVPPAPEAWTSISRAQVVADGPLAVYDMEFAPADSRNPSVTASGGVFDLVIMARSVEDVVSLGTQEDDIPVEQHLIFIWKK